MPTSRGNDLEWRICSLPDAVDTLLRLGSERLDLFPSKFAQDRGFAGEMIGVFNFAFLPKFFSNAPNEFQNPFQNNRISELERKNKGPYSGGIARGFLSSIRKCF